MKPQRTVSGCWRVRIERRDLTMGVAKNPRQMHKISDEMKVWSAMLVVRKKREKLEWGTQSFLVNLF